MKFSDFVSTKYLGQNDIPKPQMVTIAGFSQVEVEPGKVKIAVKFREFDKPLLLNKTNTKRIQAAYGNDSDATVGKKLAIFVDENVTNTKGEIVGGVRIKAPPKEEKPFDDNIPF